MVISETEKAVQVQARGENGKLKSLDTCIVKFGRGVNPFRARLAEAKAKNATVPETFGR